MANAEPTSDRGGGTPLPPYFYSIDMLRGGAALSVVLYHWAHFFPQGKDYQTDQHPLHAMFWPIYDDGWRFVNFFFCISGFVFFWLYGAKIDRGEVGGWKFVVLRFSRLYPLHLATLLVVAAGQVFYTRKHGIAFVYQDNSAVNFGLNLIFASQWRRERNLSFNGPIWSVSVEILLYIVFFVSCRAHLRRWWHLASFVVLGYLAKSYAPSLADGFFSFFIGGLAFYAVDRLSRWRLPSWLVWLATGLTILGWLVVPVLVRKGLLVEAYHWALPGGGPRIMNKRILDSVVWLFNLYLYELILFPVTLITLAILESRRGTLGKRFEFLGHITYSSYLLHFPLQLGFVLLGPPFEVGAEFYRSPASLVVFFGILIPMSLAAYRYFELPAQSFLRRKLLNSPTSKRPG